MAFNHTQSNSGHFEKQYSKLTNVPARNFEQEGLNISNIVSQTVLYLTVYSLMLPLKSWGGDSKGTLNCTWSNNGHFEEQYSKLMNAPARNFVQQTIRYLTVYGQILPFFLRRGDSKVAFLLLIVFQLFQLCLLYVWTREVEFQV